MKKIFLKMFILLQLIISTLYAEQNESLLNVYNVRGQFVGIIKSTKQFDKYKSKILSSTMIISKKGEQVKLSSGCYTVHSQKEFIYDSQLLSGDFGFKDITNEILPLDEWEAGDVEVVDINKDNRNDIIFSIYSSIYKENSDYRPRVLIQNDEGRFIDETEIRFPEISAPCLDIEIFDIDKDGNEDIFLTGYHVQMGYYLSAALLINDGTGVFSDQSDERLPKLPKDHFVYIAENGNIDNNQSDDLILYIFNGISWTIYPVIWLNDGNGYFKQDTTGRLPTGNNYGFSEILTVDIDRDGLHDIIFANQDIGGEGLNAQNACYKNTGNGYFVDETETRMPQINSNTNHIKAFDIDDDNDFDLLEVDFSKDWGGHDSQVRILTNDGEGNFSLSSSIVTGELDHFNDSEFALLNDDDLPDLFMIRVSPGELNYDILLINNGDLTFNDFSSYLPNNLDFSVSCALFDYNKDDDFDIIIANSGSIAGEAGKNLFYQNMLNTTNIVIEKKLASGSPYLLQNYPNPFNLSTTISFNITKSDFVVLKIFDINGRLKCTLINSYKDAGNQTVEWNPINISSGIYFYKITSGGYSAIKKCIILK